MSPHGLYYVEDEPGVLREIGTREFHRLFTTTNRQIALDKLLDGRVAISTIWLGINHNHVAGGPPLIYETMIFHEGYDGDMYQRRYTYRADALRGHAEALAWAQRLVDGAGAVLSDVTALVRKKEAAEP
jgi:hypothetical protein